MHLDAVSCLQLCVKGLRRQFGTVFDERLAASQAENEEKQDQFSFYTHAKLNPTAGQRR